MAPKPKSVPKSGKPKNGLPVLSDRDRKRLQADPLLQRINRRRERLRARFGTLPESWPLIREDRER